MKRIICVILTIVLLFSLSACGKKNTSSDTDQIDLEYYANLGKIPECVYSLGQNVEELKTELKAASDKGEEEYVITEGEKTVLIENGTFRYYYVKQNESNGISYIVDFDTAYGFKTGDVIIEVKNAFSKYECTEIDINEDNAFFLNDTSGGSILEYTFGKNKVMFIFQENALCATVIYDTDNWNL